jgi:hypothetical protein
MTYRSERTSIERKMAAAAAIVFVALAAASGVWFSGASTASAPEPALLRVALGASTGATAAAIYLSGTPTSVRYYSAASTYDPYGPAAGTPCSTAALAKDRVTTQVIVVPYGNYRKCM